MAGGGGVFFIPVVGRGFRIAAPIVLCYVNVCNVVLCLGVRKDVLLRTNVIAQCSIARACCCIRGISNAATVTFITRTVYVDEDADGKLTTKTKQCLRLGVDALRKHLREHGPQNTYLSQHCDNYQLGTGNQMIRGVRLFAAIRKVLLHESTIEFVKR